MHPFTFMLCAVLFAGCASPGALPVASPHVATATAAGAPATPDTSVEVRHRYVFVPGRNPLLIVERADASSTLQEVSSQEVSSQEISSQPSSAH